MATVRDPVCGMQVEEDRAVLLDHDAHVHHFCSEHCLATFQADPARYGDAHAAGPYGTHPAIRTTPAAPGEPTGTG